MVEIEIWKPIPGYEGLYEVSNLGKVKSLPRNRFIKNTTYTYLSSEKILKLDIGKSNYYRTCLSENKKNKRFLVHRLVAMSFISNPENKPMVNHINSIRTDNRVENLEWCTHSENMIHGFNKGFCNPPKGVINGQSKLTEKEVLEIRRLKNTMSQKQISINFKVSLSTISEILLMKSWKHI